MLHMKFAIITFVLLFTTLVNSQEPLAGGVRYEHLKIPMRDGIHLSAHASRGQSLSTEAQRAKVERKDLINR